jgi:hypothetical protein
MPELWVGGTRKRTSWIERRELIFDLQFANVQECKRYEWILMLFLFLIFVPSGWSFLAQSLLLAVPSVPLQLAFAGPV